MHSVLLEAASKQNGSAPVAARFQSNPHKVAALAPHSIAASVADHGILYKFADRPRLITYPSTLRLNKPQRSAVLQEISQLESIGAIERAPDHDGHKAILISDPQWERSPIPPGPWPRAQPVPVLSPKQRTAYDTRLRRDWLARHNLGLPPHDFESRVFTVNKADGGFRLCTDCRALNSFQLKAKFQLDGVKSIRHLIQPGDFGALVDIKDCFIEFGLHPSQRRFVRFRDPRLRRWQWRTMNFGMSEAPHLCTKLLRPFMRILKGLGIRCSIYLDDLLVLSQSPYSLAVSMGVAIEMLQLELGMQLKLSKCNLAPSQTFQALGIIWDTVAMTCTVPTKRIRNIKSSSSRVLNKSGAGRTSRVNADDLGFVRTRDLARIVGQIISTSVAIRSAKRRLLHIQQLLSKAVRRRGWNGEIRLTPEAVEALRWWTTEAPYLENGNDIVPPFRPTHGIVKSDACTSEAGWGGTLEILGKKFSTRGFFTSDERSQWINNLELLGHRKTVEALLPLAVPQDQWHHVHLEAFLDNVSAIKYCRVGVSRSLSLSLLGADYWDWRERHCLSISFNFVAGVQNVESGALSRAKMSLREWQLCPDVFHRACRHFRIKAQLDLFASSHNHQVPRYFSFEHDSAAEGTNAFAHKWDHRGPVYAYPPPILIARILQKLRHDGVRDAMMIVPTWMAQNWWPTLLEMLQRPPLLLPNLPWLTQDQWSRPTWPCKWNLIAVLLSGDLRHARASRRQCWTKGGHHTRRVILQSMTLISGGSRSGGRTVREVADSVLGAFARGI